MPFLCADAGAVFRGLTRQWARGHNGKSEPVHEDVGGEERTRKVSWEPRGQSSVGAQRLRGWTYQVVFHICVSQPQLCSLTSILPHLFFFTNVQEAARNSDLKGR